jgi:hypothetical protein
MSPLLVTVFIASLAFSLQDNPYKFEPESHHIVVNEGEDYEVAFNQVDNQTAFGHCYYASSLYNGDYPIFASHNSKKSLQSDTSKGLSPFEAMCGFILYTVDEKSPLKWTITAFDNYTETNFTEEVTVEFYYNMPLYLDKITVLPTASFVNFFNAGDVNLTKCSVSFDNATVDLDLNSIKVYDEDNAFKSRLSSVGGGRCGYKIWNLEQDDTRDVTLFATDNQKRVYRNISHLVVTKVKELKNRTLETYLGESATVICGKESDTSVDQDQKFCDLYDPKGVLVSHGHMCYYDLDIVTKDDFGTWRCFVGFDFIMDALEFTTELVEKGRPKIDTFVEDISEYLVVGCKLVDFDTMSLMYCKFTRPDGKMFKVTSGAASQYYNSFTSDLDNGKCSIEILKPIREEDKGTWKCEAAFNGNDVTGAFVDVEKKTTAQYNKYVKKNVRMNHSLIIDCPVPYSSDYCYITGPDGTQHKPDSSLQINSGLCFLSINEASASDNGTWICSIAQKNGLPDDTITIDVSIVELKVLYGDVEAREGDQVELICNTNGIPIEYCRFVAPTGLSYSLRKENTTQSNNKITYSGRGLEYGDCAMQINKVESSDSGIWICHISSGTSSYENKVDLSKNINLTIPSSTLSVAGSVGIAVGVLAVVVATGGFAFYRYSDRTRCGRRLNQGSVQYEARTSNESNRSGESVVLSVPQNTYNTA